MCRFSSSLHCYSTAMSSHCMDTDIHFKGEQQKVHLVFQSSFEPSSESFHLQVLMLQPCSIQTGYYSFSLEQFLVGQLSGVLGHCPCGDRFWWLLKWFHSQSLGKELTFRHIQVGASSISLVACSCRNCFHFILELLGTLPSLLECFSDITQDTMGISGFMVISCPLAI